MDELLHKVKVEILDPAFKLLPPFMDSPKARVMLYAIGLQESRFEHRRQLGGGPALGLWQFEEGGGVKGVMEHTAVKDKCKELAKAFEIPWDRHQIYLELEKNDIWAAICARLLLYTDPFRLPDLHNPEAGWNLYAYRVWRPGKPHPETWNAYFIRSVRFVTGEQK